MDIHVELRYDGFNSVQQIGYTSFREILPGHFVLCNDEEEAKYREEIKSLDSGEIIIKNGQEVKAGE